MADFGITDLLLEAGAEETHFIFEKLVLLLEVEAGGELGFQRRAAAKDAFGFVDDAEDQAGDAEHAEEAAGDVEDLGPEDGGEIGKHVSE